MEMETFKIDFRNSNFELNFSKIKFVTERQFNWNSLLKKGSLIQKNYARNRASKTT